MAIGAGGTGKTMLLRYFTDELIARDSNARLAAIDPEKRELKSYFQGVLEPLGYDGGEGGIAIARIDFTPAVG